MLSHYFTRARSDQTYSAMEMTKWFDTNYRYLILEWNACTRVDGGVDWLFDEVAETRAAGHRVKVALIGPLTLLHRGTVKYGLAHSLDLLPAAITGSQALLKRLRYAGVE
jgi:5-methyltetrahydropteroyltriglutamate--homocysteine methyltransferase